jgi:hypothetical protein
MPKDSGVSDEFFGACMSKNGKLYPLDHDSYYDGEEAVSYEEWSNENVSNGLTVVIQTDWISENGFAE